MDRIIETAAGLRIDDYKTGGSIKDKLRGSSILKGLHVQLPLYQLMLESSSVGGEKPILARLLAVGPEVEEGIEALDFDDAIRAGFLETLSSAWALARGGRFTLHPAPGSEGGYCEYCGHRATCRRTHVPTLRRMEFDPRLADFLDDWRKSTKGGRHLREAVRAASAGAAEGGED
jgi:hypothetical protein